MAFKENGVDYADTDSNTMELKHMQSPNNEGTGADWLVSPENHSRRQVQN